MKRESLSHPKMLDLAARLNITQAQAIGHITMLINWTADFAIQGDIGKWPNGAIARGAGWDASPDTFVDALTEAGWLDPHETHRLLLHDWPDHAERWVKSKLASLDLTFCPAYRGNGGDVSKDVSRDASQAVSRDPPRDQTKPNQTSISTAETQVQSQQPRGVTESLCAIEEPANGIDPFPSVGPLKEWVLTAKKFSEWEISFPDLDVLAELRKARQWLLDNPKKRKTASGMTRFLGSWLSRAQDSGRGQRRGCQSPEPAVIRYEPPKPGEFANVSN